MLFEDLISSITDNLKSRHLYVWKFKFVKNDYIYEKFKFLRCPLAGAQVLATVTGPELRFDGGRGGKKKSGRRVGTRWGQGRGELSAAGSERHEEAVSA